MTDKLAEALLRAFMTCESGDGQSRVVLEYATLEDAQDAHQAICEALAAHDAGWALVPRKITPKLRDTLLQCESGEFSLAEAWERILAAAAPSKQEQPK
jgi:hypothetical protein